MVERGHIGVHQAALLLFSLLTTKVLLIYPAVVVEAGRGAGWLLVLLNALWGVAAVLVLAGLARRFPGRGLPEIAQEVAGPVLGNLFNLLLAAGLVVLAAMVVRLLSEAFIIAILPQTPPSVLVGTAGLLAVYAAYLGLEPMARVNQIMAPLAIVAFMLVLLLLLREGEPGWLLPALGPGLPALLQSSFLQSGAWVEVLLLGIYGYAFRRDGDLRRAGLLAVVGAALALAGTAAVYIMVFGPEVAPRQPFPLYALARMVYLGRFFQRAESLFVLIWIAASLAYPGVLLHGAAETTARALGVPYTRPLLFPLALLMLSVALLPPNFIAALAVTQQVRLWGALVGFGVPLLLLLAGRMRQRREVVGRVP